MTIKKKHFAEVTSDGKEVVFRDVVSWKQDKLNHAGKRVVVTMSKEVKSRSNQQNRYYWGIVIKMLSEETGYEPEEMSDAMCMEFLKVHDEKRFQVARGTSSLSTVEFEEFMSKIRRWASQELTLFLPEPNEVEF